MNPITPTDWTELFNQMNPSTKRESLVLRTFVRNADDDVRILGAEYLKDVRIRKSTSSDVDKIVDYLRSLWTSGESEATSARYRSPR